MKVKGDEPPIKGYTDEDAFQWCIESIQACLPAAEKEASSWRSRTTGV